MSDYLWDKKGEPEPDVARLEALLGAFRHEPRPLELPAGAATPERPAARLLPFAARLRASRLFAPAALAAAAALLVASAFVASVFLRARPATRDEQAAAPESARPKRDAREEERPAPRGGEWGMLEPPPGADGVKPRGKVESAAVRTLPNAARERKVTQLTAASGRRRQKGPAAEPAAEGDDAGGGFTLEAMRAPGGASSFVENARLLTKEQLVYALRLTGAKLRDVRQKAQGATK